MKYTKHQKKIVKCINKGEIYDIITYLKFFNLGEEIKYDIDEVNAKFNNDIIPKTYYCPNNVEPRYATIISEREYNDKVTKGKINADNYKKITLKLNYNHGIKYLNFNEESFKINFYEGVYIAKFFGDIIDFLALWQYLKSEMLILEVPSDCTSKSLEIFYQKQASYTEDVQSQLLKDRIKLIDFDNFTFDDKYYLSDNLYNFSNEYYTICKEFLNKRIYPTPKLKGFIQTGFKTTEEKTQSKALFVAWLAIFVSIFLALLPHFQKGDSDYLSEIKLEIEEIHNDILTTCKYGDISTKLDVIIERLNSLKIQQMDANLEENESTSKMQQ